MRRERREPGRRVIPADGGRGRRNAISSPMPKRRRREGRHGVVLRAELFGAGGGGRRIGITFAEVCMIGPYLPRRPVRGKLAQRRVRVVDPRAEVDRERRIAAVMAALGYVRRG